MSHVLRSKEKLFGLYELDAAGTILYSRMEPAMETPPDVAGRNFFDEVAPFENVEEFRRYISDFTRSENHADSFNFTCQFDSESEAVRVLLARIRERYDADRTKSVLVHIRKA